MEIALTFRCQNALLPLAHKHAVVGLLYHMLTSCPDYAALLHDRGYPVGGKQFKLFTFSDLSGPYEIQGKQILFPDKLRLTVRSPDPILIRTLLRAAAQNRSYLLCGNPLTLEDFRVTDTPITVDTLRIRTRSPITVHITTPEGKTRYFSPEEPEFYEAISENAKAKLRAVSGMPEDFCLTLTPEGPVTRLVTTYKGIYITGWRGTFRLSGPAPVLEFLYNTGLGDRNSQGFGMFDILRR